MTYNILMGTLNPTHSLTPRGMMTFCSSVNECTHCIPQLHEHSHRQLVQVIEGLFPYPFLPLSSPYTSYRSGERCKLPIGTLEGALAANSFLTNLTPENTSGDNRFSKLKYILSEFVL